MSQFLQNFSYLPVNNKFFALLLVAWSLFIKGYTLWKASRNNQRYWFIILLLLNTLGIFELVYLKFFQKNLNLEESKTSLKKTKKGIID
ncbi:hypothetical protein A3A76_03160 [Candidatus Woesebacteria bacterium RIFCSPLOWO2_01_FULL_39_23]|uniref:DUF5652 domain-containing protein n=1 Tax=Candidatus Woesebacteria bacterium RIFCSPHIGHO2_01_FULL_40_22 TaxID=1802499 RepID=A0A1F7YJU0_9BACT|nr:MAG: hypothetical protein A2141_00865 [Candidatus Woesebacteria bacterium RBG_16_40_11]OGM27460.1 MAG: hypothetical protein A2628_01560 [Candidatus Woesebacteria bacterium RIFCSPHIGHO2_01_FULL_40_22]OGM36582.1 MAG: hypothetical protein A3E41_04085 [Candidatus Woesebacteria bacterium RIFCSPHIGHO2_12_FULL_38_9]OGM62634.1 MAG: hypothetical protein A3A76_03160 [Candidatus Woesebacteria bacterium RIFCSPLOWO2_01_FULL_39_23]